MRRRRRDWLQRRRRVFIGIYIAALSVAVLFPGRPNWTNGVLWLRPGPGLHFSNITQVLSEGPITSTTGEMTLEVFLEPGFKPGIGNQEIVSFYDDERIRPLVLGQWPRGFLLRGRADNPAGDPREDSYISTSEAGLPVPERLRHLAVTLDERGARLHVNGLATSLVLPRTIPGLGEPFGGHLLVGNSYTGWGAWRGKLRAVAIYDRTLSSAELSDHAGNIGAPAAPQLLDDTSLLALYRFEEGAGRRSRSSVAGAPDLYFPERMTRPTRSNFLAYQPFDDEGRRWMPRDMMFNVIGFLPLGFLIAWRRPPRALALAFACGFTLSLGIEIVQSLIPGRTSSLQDLACNSAGALLGALATRLRPSRQSSKRHAGRTTR